MKLTKKKVLVTSLAVSLIAILSLGSLAWFSDSDEVTNNFHVAGGDDADKIFSVDVMEMVDGDYDDDYDYIGEDKTIGVGTEGDSWNYDNITPNDVLLKRVSTLNAGSYYQWIRMKVTVDKKLVDLLDDYNLDFTSILEDMDSCRPGTNYVTAAKTPFNSDGRWSHVRPGDYTVNEEEGTCTYTFYYNAKVAPTESAVLFSTVHVPYQFTQDDMATLTDGSFAMIIKGEAVQADNTAADARAAFALVEETQEIQ